MTYYVGEARKKSPVMKKLYESVEKLVDDDYMELSEVLKGLGYKEKEFKGVIAKVDPSLSIEDQVKEALKLLLK